MNIKSLLIGSAAAIVATTGAQAADVIVAPEPEAVEYVRVCDAYGAGYFYIPGTETCLRIGGYVRYDIKGGDHAYSSKETVRFKDTFDDKGEAVKGDVYGAKRGGWDKFARFALQTRTASETEYGTLRTFTETRMNWTGDNSNSDGRPREDNYGKDSRDTQLEYAWIDLGGFRVGLGKTMYKEWTGYLGDVMQDDVISEGSFTRTGQIAYTFAGGNGFSAVVAVEQGAGSYVISDYAPHVLGGVKYEQGWGKLAAVVAYDSVIRDWSAKVRGDVNVTDQFSLWVMGGFAGKSTTDQAYGSFGGKWAVWGGAAYKATDKATLNLQAATEDWGKTSVTANVAYQLVPGFTITPEVTWTHVSGNQSRYNRTYLEGTQGNYVTKVGSKDSVQGMLRFQRSF